MKTNLFIVGVAKSGTTSLAYYLSQHPQIYLPHIKEPNYLVSEKIRRLNNSDPLKNFIIEHSVLNNLEYQLLYKDSNCRYNIDASIHYWFFIEDWMRALRSKGFDSRKIVVIVITRDPLDRLISNYNYISHLTKFNIDDYINEELSGRLDHLGPFHKVVEGSLYQEKLTYLRNNLDNVIELSFEDLIENPNREVNKIFKALQLEPYAIRDDQLNKTKIQSPLLKLINRFGLRSIFKLFVPQRLKPVLREYLYVDPKVKLRLDTRSRLESLFNSDGETTA